MASKQLRHAITAPRPESSISLSELRKHMEPESMSLDT